MDFEIITDGLEWPEGPVWMKDGSIILVETCAGRITRVRPDGTKSIVATPGGGPNGLAVGPDGCLYCCNNGGMVCYRTGGMVLASMESSPDYDGGWIDRIDIATGEIQRLYTEADGRKLAGPNDIMFDAHGGFWFSDVGKHVGDHMKDGGIFYAKADGSLIRRVVDRLDPNGIGLSPDGKSLYAALTYSRHVLGFEVTAPGEVAPPAEMSPPGRMITSFPGREYLDSLAMTADGRICVGVVVEGSGIASIDPATGAHELRRYPDIAPTNLCFGGSDMQDAWIVLSATGRLIRTRWDRPGLALAHYA